MQRVVTEQPSTVPHHEDAQHGLPYLRSLDGVRALSICLVVAAHTLPLGPKAWDTNRMVAEMGMSLFFCLSGFLIVGTLDRDPDVLAFLVKRLARIVPAMALYLTVLLVFFGLPAITYWLNLGFVSNYLTVGLHGGPVGYLWSLCVEIHFYLAIALGVAVGGRRALWMIVPAALFVTGLRIDSGVVANIKTHLRADEILLGGWLALASLRHGDRIRALLADGRRSWFLLGVVGLLLFGASHRDSAPLGYFRPYLGALWVGLIIHGNMPALTGLFASAPARYVAKISYAAYLWHGLTVSGFMDDGSVVERYLLKRPVSYALLLILAHLSTHRLEAPLQAVARRYLRRRKGLSEARPQWVV